jgi:hypothetical protein
MRLLAKVLSVELPYYRPLDRSQITLVLPFCTAPSFLLELSLVAVAYGRWAAEQGDGGRVPRALKVPPTFL